MPRVSRACVLLLVGAVAGCASRADAVRARVASELSCSPYRVVVTPVSDRTFRAVGCGTSVYYTCPFHEPCFRDGVPLYASRDPAARDEAVTTGGVAPLDRDHGAIVQAMASRQDTLRLCFDEREPPIVWMQLDAPGFVSHVTVPQYSRTEREACAQRLLTGVRIHGAGPPSRLVRWDIAGEAAAARLVGLSAGRHAALVDALESHRETVRACFGAAQHAHVRVSLTPDGRVASVTLPPGLPDDVQRCIRADLATVRLAGLAQVATTVWDPDAPSAVEQAGPAGLGRPYDPFGTRADVPHPDTATSSPTIVAAASTPLADAGAAPAPIPPVPPADARLIPIYGQAADIVACVGRSPVGVRATWNTDGVVSLGVQGMPAGSAEERCVRSVVGTLHVAPGAAGDEIVIVRSAP